MRNKQDSRFWMSAVMLAAATTITGCATSDDGSDGSGAEEAGQAAADSAGGSFCVTTATTDATASVPDATTDLQCFATLSKAIAAATDGAVVLPDSATADTVDEATLNGGAVARNPIIALEYKDSRFRNLVLTVRSPDGQGCTAGRVLGVRRLTGAANNSISSARAFANCHHSVHFADANFLGASHDCGTQCSFIGAALNDRTTSIAWSI